jgi:hypothetical protein
MAADIPKLFKVIGSGVTENLVIYNLGLVKYNL